jgi:enterochelin esterase family protein
MRHAAACLGVFSVFGVVAPGAFAQPGVTPPTASRRPAAAAPDAPPPLDVATLKKALAAAPSGATATALLDKLRRWYGDGLASGGVKTEGLEVAFAIEAPGAKSVTAQSVNGLIRRKLSPIADSGVWVAVETFADGTALRFGYNVDGRTVGMFGVETYAPHPDSLPRPGVPKGKVIQQKPWQSRIYPGTTRDWWIYVPAQYRAARPAALMVFQDGASQYLRQTPTILDNLIHRGDIPVMAAIFINPGVGAGGSRNRSVEYDTVSDTYARFLLEEILPEAEKTVKLRKDPESRGIAGMSSGGICAFTVAWHRPDQFRRVLSWAGSFVNIAAGESQRDGGHNYPPLIRRSPRKPIRVLLQDGEQDLEGEAGSWTLANMAMERALTFAGWDAKVVWGRGFHTNKHGFAIMPESLRWLFRDWK